MVNSFDSVNRLQTHLALIEIASFLWPLYKETVSPLNEIAIVYKEVNYGNDNHKKI